MVGYQVTTFDQVVSEIDILDTTASHSRISSVEPMRGMRSNAIFGNVVHFDKEIKSVELESFPGNRVDNIKSQVDEFDFPDGHDFTMLASGCKVPTTEVPTMQAPTTEAPTTEAPTAEVPTAETPTTAAPTMRLAKLPHAEPLPAAPMSR